MGKVELNDRKVRSSLLQPQNEDRFKKALEKVQQERESRERNRVKNLLSLRSA